MTEQYLVHGVVIRTTDLPLAAVRADDAEPELTVAHRVLGADRFGLPADSGRVLQSLEIDGRRWRTTRSDDIVALGLEGLWHGTIDLTNGNVRLDVVSDLPRTAIGTLVANTFTSMYLVLRGETVLHASAVVSDREAYAVIGPAGVGKSTVAAWLCLSGALLFSDDTLRLCPFATPVIAYRGTLDLRLREGAATLAAPASRRSHDRIIATPAAYDRPNARLRALVLPSRLPPGASPAVTLLSGADAMITILRSPRIGAWSSNPANTAQLASAADLARRLPVIQLGLPAGPPFPVATGRRALELIRSAAASGHGHV